MSEVRQINWQEVAEAYWNAYREEYFGPQERAERPPWKSLSQRYQDAIIAGCKAAFELAVEES